MRRYKDMTGQRFGHLVALRYIDNNAEGDAFWMFRCDCGNEKRLQGSSVRQGHTSTCGCGIYKVTHGMTRAPEYRSWYQMKHRCQNPFHHAYADYGGRGIKVCDRWQTFENFYADMGPRPKGTSIDRINNNGSYEPGNCRWSTSKEQAANRRQRLTITKFGVKELFQELIRKSEGVVYA